MGFFNQEQYSLGCNIGFGPGGRFLEDPTGMGYRYDDVHYDDDLMREALKNVYDGDYSLLGWGKKRKNNCQDWADRLRDEYHRLEKEKMENDQNGEKECKDEIPVDWSLPSYFW